MYSALYDCIYLKINSTKEIFKIKTKIFFNKKPFFFLFLFIDIEVNLRYKWRCDYSLYPVFIEGHVEKKI